jgi:predicted Rossmann fold nucleotide-binding protein DprA/Smf involved in DNA uptake
MSDKRITKRFMFEAIATFLEAAAPNMDATPEGMEPSAFLEDAVAFCNKEIALLNKKHAKSSQPTEGQLANIALKEDIVAELTSPMRATEIANELNISVQKCSALLRQLVADGRVVRNEDKKVVTFSVA